MESTNLTAPRCDQCVFFMPGLVPDYGKCLRYKKDVRRDHPCHSSAHPNKRRPARKRGHWWK